TAVATTVAPTTVAPTVATTAAPPPATEPPTTPAPPPATAAPTTAPTPTTHPGPQPCKSSGLKLTLGASDGTAGSVYTPIVFTNTGSVSCTLDGHPGVSFVDSHGTQVGPSAARTDVATPTITLAPGGHAHANLQVAEAGNFDCTIVNAPTLKVYPPDETVAKTIHFPTDICSDIPQGQLTIDVVKAGSSGV
ncbi:MAG TPA: DUF4232 domain-containing protein, partial [Ilumatobacteraceae bacterium]